MIYREDITRINPLIGNMKNPKGIWVRGDDGKRYRCEVFRSYIQVVDKRNEYICELIYTDDTAYRPLATLLIAILHRHGKA